MATATDAFISAKARIDAALAKLAERSGEHFGAHPDEIHWGHVGSLNHCLELLQRAVEACPMG